MKTGIVKWFSNSKGYGFISAEDVGEDIFAHYTAILSDGYRSLRAGQLVNFELSTGKRGLQAQNISVCDNEA